LTDGGFGSAVLEYFASRGLKKSVVRLGVPDRFVEQGTQAELYRECGFDAEGICQAVRKVLIGKCENVKM
jgi:1-deoxy-D-xylulose-5-phosphate synthase